MKANRCRKGRLFRIANMLVSVIILIFFSVGNVFALPAGQQVVNGQAGFITQGSNLTITNSPNSIINWQGFSINNNEAVRFIQQYGSSAVLNRVIGQDPSRILGILQSNGRVFLINPNGILFGQGARIDVNGLFASTLNISNQDFLAGKHNFTAGAIAGSIQNQGTITTPEGGKVYLIAPDIENSGIINSPKGDVILAAGHSVQLVDSLDPDISIVVSAPENKAVNLGQIIAQSGKVGIYGGLISQRGIVNADSAVVGENGRIFFKASKDVTLDAGSTTSANGGTIKVLGDMESGTVRVSGTLDASAPNGGDGGFIETSAAHVKVDDSARITTLAPYGKNGMWLLDPVDFTIAASGGDMTGTTLSGNLAGGNITILSSSGSTGVNGDINVNDTVSWTSSNSLTLSAYRNININSALTHSGGNAALLTLTPNTGGGVGSDITGASGSVNLAATDSLTISGNSYTLIGDVNELQAMGLAGYKALRQNIDASATSGWNSDAGFVPVGNFAAPFTGIFDGLGHTITDLYINRPTTDFVGLFGYNSGGVQNVGLVNGTITGQSYVGGLVGRNYGTITNSYSTGTVSGNSDVGGLVGYNSGSIDYSYSTGTVSGNSDVGGLVGWSSSSSTITNSYSTGTGTVTGTYYVGGLVGYNNYGSISNSYNTRTVTGSGDYVGGLVGYSNGGDGGDISNSYSTGTVSGNSGVGGLVGYNSGSIDYSYSTGKVTGSGVEGGADVGGLVGYNDSSGIIGSSYSTGEVSGTTNVGGLVGFDTGGGGAITNSYWDTQTSGQATSDGGTGKPTAEMKTLATFVGWEIANIGGSSAVWRIYDDNANPELRTYPLLRSFLTPLTITADNVAKTYDGNPYVSALTNPIYSIPDAGSSDLLFNTANAYNSAVNAGSYTPGLYSTQQGYDIGYVNGLLTIYPAEISTTIINLSGSRAYDGTANVDASIFTLSGLVSGQTLTLTGVGTVADKNVGVNKPVTLGTLALVDGGYGDLAGNYSLIGGTHTASITARPLTFTATGVSKVYDGLLSANVIYGDNRVTGDVLSLGGSASYLDKNVGIAKTVNVSGIALTGADAGNYSLNNATAATTADITVRGLIVTAATNTKGYDGNTSAAATPTITSGSIAGGDTATLSEVYDSKIAGTGKTLLPAATINDGNNGNNYLVTYVNNTTGVIDPGQIVSGRLDVAAEGKTIYFVVNGTLLPDQASTDESGNYSGMFPLNSIPDNSALLAYVANESASVYLATGGGNITNLLLSTNTVIASSGGGAMSNATLGTAKGSLLSGDIPYSVSGTDLTLSDGFHFLTASGANYSLNGNITTNGGNQTYNGPLTLVKNAALSTGTGNINFGGLVTGTSYNLTLNSQGMVTQTAPISVSGLELLGTGATYNLIHTGNAVTTLAGNTGTVNFTNSAGIDIGTVNTAGLATSGDLTLSAGGDITLSGLINAGTGNVTLNSGGAIINGMGSSTSISAGSLFADAANGIGSGDPLMTGVHNIDAVNTTFNNIEIDNTGVLAVSGLSNGGTGNVILQNIGEITTDTSTVTSSGGAVSITAHSPLTIGTGGVSAYGSISLEASPSGGLDDLTINGNILSSNGNISLMAGGSIAISPGISLSAPNGTITLNGTALGTGNQTATDNIVSSLMTAMEKIALYEKGDTVSAFMTASEKIATDEKGDDEDERKKKTREGGEQTTDDKKTDDSVKKYCN